jgi:hypothetical protein
MARRRYGIASQHERGTARLGSMVRAVALMDIKADNVRGPLLFSLLLSFLLSRRAREDQMAAVFSGVFTIVWVGKALVTFQIKLLGGNM